MAETIRLAKGPRLPRCGHCHGCTRRDCGGCIPCRDKRKFNGPGVKKQACVMRRCHQLTKRSQLVEDHDFALVDPRLSPGLDAMEPSVPTFDFDDPAQEDMHIDPESDMQLLFPLEVPALPAKSAKEAPRRSSPASPQGEARRSNSRLHRCGKCVACKGRDCGRCQNCADKPRFGGKGVKKQACVARRCNNLSKREDDVEEVAPQLAVAVKPLERLHGVTTQLGSRFEFLPVHDKSGSSAAMGSPTGVMDFAMGQVTPPPDASPSSEEVEGGVPATWPEGWGEWTGPLDNIALEPPCHEPLPAMPLRGACTGWEDALLDGLAPINREPTLNLDDWPGWL